MIAPVFILILSFVGAGASVLFYGPVTSDPLLLSVICVFAAAILIAFEYQRPHPRYIVIDGSNVLHWQDKTPSIDTVRQVLGVLMQQGYVPLVWFDANVGYKIGDRYLGPYPLSQMLKIPVRQVFIAPKGTLADPLLLDGATALQAKVVTNDQFRDWVESYPQVKDDGFLVPGHMRRGEIVLDFAV